MRAGVRTGVWACRRAYRHAYGRTGVYTSARPQNKAVLFKNKALCFEIRPYCSGHALAHTRPPTRACFRTHARACVRTSARMSVHTSVRRPCSVPSLYTRPYDGRASACLSVHTSVRTCLPPARSPVQGLIHYMSMRIESSQTMSMRRCKQCPTSSQMNARPFGFEVLAGLNHNAGSRLPTFNLWLIWGEHGREFALTFQIIPLDGVSQIGCCIYGQPCIQLVLILDIICSGQLKKEVPLGRGDGFICATKAADGLWRQSDYDCLIGNQMWLVDMNPRLKGCPKKCPHLKFHTHVSVIPCIFLWLRDSCVIFCDLRPLGRHV